MNTPPAAVDRQQLKSLAQHGAVKSVVICGSSDSFCLRVLTAGGGEALLHERRGGKLRSWRRLETVLTFLKTELGIAKATIEFERWEPQQDSLA